MRIGQNNGLNQNLENSGSIETRENQKADSKQATDNQAAQQTELAKADVRSEMIEDFIQAAEAENDNFTPVNQLDLAAFTRVTQNDAKNTETSSDMAQQFRKAYLAMIASMKA